MNAKPPHIRINERSASIGIGGGTRLMVLMGVLALFAVAGVAYVTVRISGGEDAWAEGQGVLVSGEARIDAGQDRLDAGRWKLLRGRVQLDQARHLRWALVATAIFFGAASLVLGFRRTKTVPNDDTR